TPEFFRSQLDALRPSDEIRADIQEVAGVLAVVQEPLFLLRLALAASELNAREYQVPSGIELPRLLVGLGEPDLAIAQVLATDNSVHGNDRVGTGMALARILQGQGYEREALKVFETLEPLGLFGGPKSSGRVSSLGPIAILRSWAQASLEIKAIDYFIAMVERLDITGVEDPPGEYTAEDNEAARQRLIGRALGEALRKKRTDDATKLEGT